MPMGTVKWFRPTKGYGFIELASGEKDIFVHISAVQKSNIPQLQDGQAVMFDIEERKGRRSAVNLRSGAVTQRDG